MLFPSASPTKILYSFLVYPIHFTWPARLILLALITLIIFGEVYNLWSSSLCNLLQSHATFSLLGPNNPLSTLFSNSVSPYSSLSMRGEVSHPYKTVYELETGFRFPVSAGIFL
jgi:hypothetical protein